MSTNHVVDERLACHQTNTGSDWPPTQDVMTDPINGEVSPCIEAHAINLGHLINRDTGESIGILSLKSMPEVGLFSYMSGPDLREMASSAIRLADAIDQAEAERSISNG